MAGIGANMAVVMGTIRIRKFYSLVTKRYSYIIKIIYKD